MALLRRWRGRCSRRSAALRREQEALARAAGALRLAGATTGATLVRKLNADQKRARAAAELRLFVQEYGRKARKGRDPNDRGYDREVEDRVKRMRPEELSRLLEDDGA